MSKTVYGVGGAVFGFLVSALSAQLAFAQYACHDGDPRPLGVDLMSDPCPGEEVADLREKGLEPGVDVRLPMPGGLEMVFHTVEVPGRSAWGDRARYLEFGDPGGGLFEASIDLSVAGSFPTKDGGSWLIVLGKYEVSVGQMAAVFGDGDLAAGLVYLNEASAGREPYASLVGAVLSDDLRRQLARPARTLPVHVWDDFTVRYTRWCYATPACLERLPTYGTMPGFFRLPTEVEWEYVAREGREGFEGNGQLPFDSDIATVRQHAYVTTNDRQRDGPTPIGRLKPTGGRPTGGEPMEGEPMEGFYDLFGNVSELTDDRFLAEPGQGKPGGRVARGGSYQLNVSDGGNALRVTLRDEQPVYTFNAQGLVTVERSEKLGARLALGSQVAPDQDTLRDITAEYLTDYRTAGRLASPADRSTDSGPLRAADQLSRLEVLVGALETTPAGSPEYDRLIATIRGRAEAVKLELQATAQELSSQLIRNAIVTAGEAGRSGYELRRRQALIEHLSRNPVPSTASLARIADLEAGMASKTAARNFSEDAYIMSIRQLASYRDFGAEALDLIDAQSLPPLDRVGFELVKRHAEQLLAGDADVGAWREELRRIYADESLFLP